MWLWAVGTAAACEGYAVWPETSLVKIFRDARPPARASTALELEAARGEVIAGQIAIRAGDLALARTDVRVTPLRGESLSLPRSQVRLFLPHYVRVDKPSGNRITQPRDWPDPLPPLDPFDVEPKQTQPVWVQVTVPRDMPPGEYRGLAVIAPTNQPASALPLRLQVHRATLPEVPRLRTAFGVWWDGIAQRFGLERGSPEFLRVADSFCEFLLDHRISPLDPPVDPLSPQADRYLSDPRITSVRIPFEREKLAETGLGVGAKPWRDKAFFYLLDEPILQQFPIVREDARLAAEQAPGIRRLCTIQPDRRLAGSIDVWCPNLEAAYIHAEKRGQTTNSFGFLLGLPLERQSRISSLSPLFPTPPKPAEVWWYTAVVPKYPYPTFLLDDDAIAPRALFWMAAMDGVDGMLYINTIHWGPPGWDPWARSVISMPKLRNNGDGLLIYTKREKAGWTGERPIPVSHATPISSIRLEAIRDGIEDYDLLRMLGERIDGLNQRLGCQDLPGAGTETRPYCGQDRIREIAGRLIRDPRDWDRDPHLFLEARNQLLCELDQLNAHPWAVVGTLPRDRTQTPSARVLVFGAVEPGSTIRVNGRAVPLKGGNGQWATGNGCTFDTVLPLEPGPNEIEVVVEKAGMTKWFEREIMRVVSSPDLPYEPAKKMVAVRCAPGEAPNLDGRLTEGVWRRAWPIGLNRNLNGAIWPTAQTRVRAAYDERGLWLGLEMTDVGCQMTDVGYLRAQGESDMSMRGVDSVSIYLAADRQARRRLMLVVTASGERWEAETCRAATCPDPLCGRGLHDPGLGPDRDPRVGADGGAGRDGPPSSLSQREREFSAGHRSPPYNEVHRTHWLSAISHAPDKWTAEVFIPWSDLKARVPRVASNPCHTLLINFSRCEPSTGEQTWWSSRFGARDQFEKFGEVLGLGGA